MLRLGNREFAWGGAELGEMRDSNELLGDGDALRARLEADGVRPHHPHACTLPKQLSTSELTRAVGGCSTCCSAT